MPDPRILKSGDGWRVVEESALAFIEVQVNGVLYASFDTDMSEGCVIDFSDFTVADLPRIAAALTALHEVLTERTTSTTNSQE